MAELKNTLQQSNLDIDTILSIAQSLPRYAKPEGMYVWKKLTAEGGDFVDYVVADTEDAYPDGGTQDGYWYELVKEGVSGIEIGAFIPSSASKTISIPTGLKSVSLVAYYSTASVSGSGLIAGISFPSGVYINGSNLKSTFTGANLFNMYNAGAEACEIGKAFITTYTDGLVTLTHESRNFFSGREYLYVLVE